MIDISIFHKSNQDGDNILKIVKENFDAVNSEETLIDDDSFININIKNEPSKFHRIINPPQSQINCMNKDIMYKLLKHNGIAYRRKSREIIARYYEVLVFDISVISIKQKILAGIKNPISYIKQDQCLKAAELSKKAVYHLGLNYALVKIAYTASKEYKVVDVEPSPTIRPRDLHRLIIVLKRIYRTEANLAADKEVKLGADPEFMLSQYSKMIPASSFFPHHGTVGCDNIRTRNRQQHPIGELRPQPSISPLRLTENVKAALVRAIKMAPYRNIKWVAGSRPFKGYPIGGHIHFSNIKLNFAVLRSLDNFLAIPMLMIENSHSAGLRRKRYGALADYRIKKYGGFEYRTLGSWLVSHDITKAVLCLAKIVVSHYLELSENYLASVEAQQAFYKGDKEYFKPIYEDLWSRISQTGMYPQYANELQIIVDMIKDGLQWNEKEDLRKAWEMAGNSKKIYSIYKKKRKPKIKNPHNPARNSHSRNTVTSRRRHTARSRSSRSSINAVLPRSSGNSNTSNRAVPVPTPTKVLNSHFNPPRNRLRTSFTTTLH